VRSAVESAGFRQLCSSEKPLPELLLDPCADQPPFQLSRYEAALGKFTGPPANSHRLVPRWLVSQNMQSKRQTMWSGFSLAPQS
jgi:hypothetical protein